MKRLIDRFTDEFDKHLKSGEPHEVVFEKAIKDFEVTCGFTPYSSLNSYRTTKNRKRKK